MKKNSIIKTVLVFICIMIMIGSLFSLTDNVVIYKARKYVKTGRIREGLEYYNRIITLFPDSRLVDDALYEAGNALWNGTGFEKQHIVEVCTNGDIISKYKKEDINIELANRYWTALVNKFPDSSLKYKTGVKIAEVCLAKGDWDGILEILHGEPLDYGKQCMYAARLKVEAYLAKNQPERALDVLQQVEKPLSVWLEMLRGDVLAAKRDFDGAENVYTGIEISSKDSELRRQLKERIEKLKCLQQDTLVEDCSLKGKVAVNGEGLAGVKVKLTNEYINGDEILTYTNMHGEYCFPYIPEGVYLITTMVPDECLEKKYVSIDGISQVVFEGKKSEKADFNFRDKIKLKLDRDEQVVHLCWEDTAGAEKYNIYIGEVKRNKGNSQPLNPVLYSIMGDVVIKQEDDSSDSYTAYYALAGSTGTNTFTIDGDRDLGKCFSPYIGQVSAIPGFIVGMPYYGGEFVFKVEAVDYQGNVITESQGCLTIFPSKDTEKSYSLITNYRFEGAKDLLMDADNVDDILLLARLYEATFKFEDSADKYRRLFNKTGDCHYLIQSALMWERGEKYEKAITALEALLPDYMGGQYGRLGKLYFWLGDEENARKYLEKGEYSGHEIKMQVLYHMLREDYQKVWAIVNSSPLTPFKYAAQKSLEETENCSSEVLESFTNSLRYLTNPSKDNRQKFVVSYRDFRDKFGEQFPYMKVLVFELGNLYWDL